MKKSAMLALALLAASLLSGCAERMSLRNCRCVPVHVNLGSAHSPRARH
jgi:hypothetical protein